MSETEQSAPSRTASTGRYLYCLVDASDDSVADRTGLEATGIGGNPVSVLTADERSVGAVVHTKEEPYDSTDLAELRDWLLAHQQVVEAAGDRFGTPLPVRFDTVIQGDDGTVREWLARNSASIVEAFDSVAGRWEYRATLSWDSTRFEAEQRAADPTLAEVDRELAQARDGKRFLLQKRYDKRLRELTRQRRKTLQERLVDRLSESAARVTERPLRSEAAASLDVEPDSDAVAQVAVLAALSEESTLGDALEEMTDVPGVDVRFTGPWPPYTFAPAIEED